MFIKLQQTLSKNVSISDSYRAPLRMALVFSAIIAFLAIFTLDGGETAQLSGIGLSIFWAWVLVAMWRRPRNPTSLDLLLVRNGSLPFVVAFQVAIHFVWHWRGLQ